MLPEVDLDLEEVRVLGCLIEKQLTTPQYYPLTLNALVLACNQSSNRDPVVAYTEDTVEKAVTRAKARGLARFVHPSHGRSALRYRHELGEQLGLDHPQLALLAVLMLRGPQTPGELRARTERMAAFDGLSELEAELSALAAREEPLVRRLPRSPAQKEDRYAHCLGAGGASALEPAAGPAPSADESAGGSEAGGGPGDRTPTGPEALAALAGELADLRAELWRLRAEFDDLRRQLGA
jgi:uncharacterized protein YceH (UPF0502 family)